MMRFDRFEWDLFRNIWYCFIFMFFVLTVSAFVFGFVYVFIFGFPKLFTVKEILVYNLVSSGAIGVVSAFASDLIELRREVERLKLANSEQVRE